MKTGFYPKLALDGIKKNKRMYFPYILTCIGMVMMQYIIGFLQYSDMLASMPGARTAQSMIEMGGWVIAVFAGLFLFYTNSFLIRHRKKEFGLYNILGMGKRSIGFILFWENLIISVFSIAVGLILGIAFSKLAELGFVNIVKGDVTFAFTVSAKAISKTVSIFGVIFVLLFLNAIRQVRFSSAISLLRSENVGEKPPKGNWFVGILGVVVLGVAYYIAVSIEDPITALTLFFAAVIMVIFGTYLIMIAGSVLFCRILQKKKNYYYKSNHFVSVSSMVYRMKRNGAGLASICILATMVLVMISSTATLYIGSEDTLNTRYPRDINMDFRFEDVKDLSNENIDILRNDIITVADKHGVEPENRNDYRSAAIVGLLNRKTIETDVTKVNEFNLDTYSDVYSFYIVPLEDYNTWASANETLEEGEALLYTYRSEYNEGSIAFNGGASFRIKKHVDDFFGSGEAAMNVIPTIAIIVPDFDSAIEEINKLTDFNGDRMLQLHWTYNFDTGAAEDKQLSLNNDLNNTFRNFEINKERNFVSNYIESRETERADYYGTFGGLFYLGILLSIVFIFATVLIIYYKQVSEGYEDQSRFEIMQKVGITKKEIRKSINSQLLTVFFLPIIGAGLHLAFAFPILRKLLLLFNFNNVALFAITTVVCFLVFALFYTVVYRITSNAYYKIVSGAKGSQY